MIEWFCFRRDGGKINKNNFFYSLNGIEFVDVVIVLKKKIIWFILNFILICSNVIIKDGNVFCLRYFYIWY